MGDQANFIVIQPKSSDPSPKRINNDRSLGGKYRVCVCVEVWVYVSGGGGRDRLTRCMDEYLPLVNI